MTTKSLGESLRQIGSSYAVFLLCSVIGQTPSGGDKIVSTIFEAARQNGVNANLVTSDALVFQERISSQFLNDTIEMKGPFWSFKNEWLAYFARSLSAVILWFIVRLRRVKLPSVVILSSSALPDLLMALAFSNSSTSWVVSWELDLCYSARKLSQPSSVRAYLRPVNMLRIMLSHGTQEIILRIAKHKSPLILVSNANLKDTAVARGFASENVIIRPVGVDIDVVGSEQFPAEKCGNRQFDCIFLGRFVEQKGLQDLISIWDLVIETKPDAKLLVVGDGTGKEARWFKEQIRMRASSIYYRGSQHGREVFVSLSSANLLLFTSSYEGNPLVLMEAMACGTIPIAYNIPSVADIYCDLFPQVTFGDHNKMANEVLSYLNSTESMRLLSQRLIGFASSKAWPYVITTLITSDPLRTRFGLTTSM